VEYVRKSTSFGEIGHPHFQMQDAPTIALPCYLPKCPARGAECQWAGLDELRDPALSTFWKTSLKKELKLLVDTSRPA